MHRCLVSSDDLRLERVRLPAAAAHHVGHVLRARPGDRIRLFDGHGSEATAEVESASGSEVVVRVVQREAAAPSSGPRVVLLQAMPKGRLIEWIIEKAVEVGVDAVIPVVATRSISRPDAERAEGRVERWHKIAEGATRQCGGTIVPEVSLPCPLSAALDTAGPLDLLLVCCISPDALELGPVLRTQLAGVKTVGIMIGPEGDWSPEEVSEARRRGGIPVTFGGHVLRVETAAIYALSAVAYERRFL
jgi:16S rRNA (uracil1498-N3)-methyltransferase